MSTAVLDPPATVLFLPEVCERLRISYRAGRRMRQYKTFPIPELPSLDKRPRYSSRDVEAFIARDGHQKLRRR